MKVWLQKYFGFSKGEFNGLLALIMLIVIIKFSPLIYRYFKPLGPELPITPDLIQKIVLSDKKNTYSMGYNNYSSASNNTSASKLFNFDPNTIGLEDWQTLGLSVKQAQSIINYRNKGGKFYRAEDLQKMYTISPQMYQKILPYVHINAGILNSNGKKVFQYENKEYIKKTPVIVEINHADSAQLNQIKGIGPAFALRILKYRERIGGFYNKEQLMEVYGLDSAKFTEIKDQIIIDAGAIKKVNINTAGFNDLKNLPYLSYKQMNAIVQYRKQHGNFNSEADLKSILILSPQIIDKVAPYLSF